jgi:hypothetical protein
MQVRLEASFDKSVKTAPMEEEKVDNDNMGEDANGRGTMHYSRAVA